MDGNKKIQKSFFLAGGIFLLGSTSLAISACGIQKSDFNVIFPREIENLNYITQTGTDSNSSPAMEGLLGADPLGTASKSNIQLAKTLNNLNTASNYAKNIVNNDQVIKHEYNKKGEVVSSSYSTIGKEQRLNIYLANENGIEGEPLTIDEASSILEIGFDTFNYVWGGAQSMNVHYKTDASDPNNPSYYLYKIKVYLDQQVPGKNTLGDEANYWYSSNKNYQKLPKEERKVKASDYATAARLEMDSLIGAPYSYMWETNMGLNGAKKCIDDQANVKISNMLGSVTSCKDFFGAPVTETGEINSGSGYYANDADNTITFTFSDHEDDDNSGYNLPLSIVFNQFDWIVFWPISQSFMANRYGSVFGPNGPLWNIDATEVFPSSTGQNNDEPETLSSIFLANLDSFGLQSFETVSNGPFYISDWIYGYQARYQKSPEYRFSDDLRVNSFTVQQGLKGGSINANLFEKGWIDSVLLDYDYNRLISAKNKQYMGAQPSAGTVTYLVFNTINGDANYGSKFELTQWGTRYAPLENDSSKTAMSVQELATHSRNFRNAIVYAFDAKIYWGLEQFDNYMPVLSQASDIAANINISSPNANDEEKNFQEWMNDTYYYLPDKEGMTQTEAIKVAAPTTADYQKAFVNSPSGTALNDQRRSPSAAEYYWNQWVEEAKSVGISEENATNVVMNVISSNAAGATNLAFALNNSIKNTALEGKITFQGKEILNYYPAGFWQGQKGVWDLGTAGWTPDYLDPATFYTTFMAEDPLMRTNSEAGYWNYVQQLLELKFANDSEFKLQGFNNSSALLGDLGENELNSSTISVLGKTSTEIINAVLDLFYMKYNDEEFGAKGSIKNISDLEFADYQDLRTRNSSYSSGGSDAYQDGFLTLSYSENFWNLSPQKRFAAMVVMESLLHYGSPMIGLGTEAIGFGVDRIVGVSKPTSGLFNYRYMYPCYQNAEDDLPSCENLFNVSSQ